MKNRMNHDRIKKKIVVAISKMGEDEFTYNVLLPIFAEIGYRDVCFHGGSYEEGKDFICWKPDDISIKYLAVGQAKKFTKAQMMGHSIEFKTALYQLREAKRKPVKSNDGRSYLPERVFLVTPYALDSRDLRNNEHELVGEGLFLLDGSAIADLLIDKLPELVQKMVGLSDVMRAFSERRLINQELISALNIRQGADVSYFYNNLNFLFGRSSSSFFFGMSPASLDCEVSISSEHWVEYKESMLVLQKSYNDNFMVPSIVECERSFERDMEEFERPENKKMIEKSMLLVQEANSNLLKLKKVHDVVRDGDVCRMSAKGGVNSRYNSAIDFIIRRIRNFLEMSASEVFHRQLCIVSMLSSLECLIKDIDCGSAYNAQIYLMIYIVKENIIYSIDIYDIERVSKANPEYSFILRSGLMAGYIREAKNRFVSEVDEINRGRYSMSELRNFLDSTFEELRCIDVILRNENARVSLGFDSCQKNYYEAQGVAFKIPVHRIIDAGVNVAIYGNAGAGKTTTMQKYVMDFSGGSSGTETSLWLPMNRVIKSMAESGRDESEFVEDCGERLVASIVKYLSKEINILTLDDFILFAKEKSRIIFLLDGIDEAYKDAPWIIDGIVGLSKIFSNCQIVVSSRINDEYVNKIPFLGVSLLPFTEEQLRDFVSGWFKDKVNKGSVLLEHIRENKLEGVVGNPLLATMLCAIAEEGVPLPLDEQTLYRQRFRLLLGYYDAHKGVSRLTLDSDTLMEVARSIAYTLHVAQRRENHLEKIVDAVEDYLNGRYSRATIISAVNELKYPCNVLVGMTEDGQLGLGHLRFQEYLVAEELKGDRSIDIVQLTRIPWWRGSLVMYAKMVSDISHLVRDMSGKYGRLDESKQTLIEMAAAKGGKAEADILSRIYAKSSNAYDDSNHCWVDDDSISSAIRGILGGDYGAYI